MEKPRSIARIATASGLIAVALLASRTAHAGCGCDKPPPPPAQIRPHVAYAGAPISFFSSGLQVGSPYVVSFVSATGGATASVAGIAVSRRDLADGVYKPQVTVALPDLPLGPASVTLSDATTQSALVAVSDDQLTVAPAPIPVPDDLGEVHLPGTSAAVGRDGVAYLALDLTSVQQPVIFDARAAGYPLDFGIDDVVFWNVQGFLMQRLVQDVARHKRTVEQPVPGMFVFPSSAPASDSDLLHYSRHEFHTYFLQHAERQPHAVSPDDPNWHLDGSAHVDHNHLILAIAGNLPDGSLPPAGATPPFDLVVRISSLFSNGIVGIGSVEMDSGAQADGYDPAAGPVPVAGDVFTTGTLQMKHGALIDGDATAARFKLAGDAQITGKRLAPRNPSTFMAIKVPDGLTNLGDVGGWGVSSQTIVGPGSFLASSVTVAKGATLYIDNSAGPVTLYVQGDVKLAAGGTIATADPSSENFAMYVSGKRSSVSIAGRGSSFAGVVYAPDAKLEIGDNSQFRGAFVADDIELGNGSRVDYDATLAPR